MEGCDGKASRRLTSAKGAYYLGDIVFLEDPDGGDAGCAGVQAGLGVLQSYSTQCEYWDFGAAGLVKRFETGRGGSGGVLFFEDWSEKGDGGAVGGGLGYFFR